jgi:hypothetical protein
MATAQSSRSVSASPWKCRSTICHSARRICGEMAPASGAGSGGSAAVKRRAMERSRTHGQNRGMGGRRHVFVAANLLVPGG